MRPNILLIVADSARPDHFSCYGYGRTTTPFIDSLAASSTLFERAVSQSVWTLPTHGTLFTGLYPQEHGLIKAFEGISIYLPDRFQTLAEELQRAGYATAGFSNNPWVGQISRLNRGFDVYLEANMELSRGTLDLSKAPLRLKLLNKLGSLTSRVRVQTLISYLIAQPVFTSATVDIVAHWFQTAARRDQPFFAFINFMDAHQPYYPPRGVFKRLNKRKMPNTVKRNWDIREYFRGNREPDATFARDLSDFYDASLHFLDAQIGRLLNALKALGMFDDTVIVITADHGKTLADFDIRNPLHFVRDANVHIPLIIRAPEGFPAGSRHLGPVELVDLFYTLLELAGTNESPNVSESRPTLLDRLSRDEDLPAFFEAVLPYTVEDPEADYVVGLRSSDCKYIRSQNQDELAFDLRIDPDEQQLRPASQVEATTGLRWQLDQRLMQMQSAADEATGQSISDLDAAVVERLRGLGYLD